MKKRIIKPLVMLSAMATLTHANAQNSPPTPPPDKQTVTEAKSDARLESKSQEKEKPERPERPKVEKVSRAEVKESIDEIKTNFRAKAEDYVRKQKEIVAELKTAKGEEKSKVREKLKDLKEQWRDDQPDVREMVSDLKEKIDKEKDKGKDRGKPRD